MTNLNDNRYKQIEKTLKSFGYSKDSLIEALHIAQDTFGYLSDEVLMYIAQRLALPIGKVYGVATFYHYFRLKPKGKHTCIVCTGTACYIKGAKDILKSLEIKYNIKVSQTTKDNMLTLLNARCVGSCSIAPVIIIDNKTIGKCQDSIAINECEGVIHDN